MLRVFCFSIGCFLTVAGIASEELVISEKVKRDSLLEKHENKGFFKVDDTLKPSLINFERAKKATFRFIGEMNIDFDNNVFSPAGSCTGTYISNTGHFVTAMHCIRNCLIKYNDRKIYTYASHKFMKPDQVPGTFAHQEMFIVNADESKLSQVSCKIEINGIETKAQVISTGSALADNPSYLSFINNFLNFKQHMPLLDYIAKGFLSMDFAVLKLEMKQPTSCMKVAEQNPEPYSLVWNLAYPAETNRPGINNSDGKSKYLSLGKTFQSYGEASCYADVADKYNYFTEGKLNIQFRNFLFNLPYTTYSSIEAMSGSSGSSAINEQGKIVGIIVRAHAHKKNRCANSTQMINLIDYKPWILSQAKLQGQEEQVFNCK